MKIPPSTPQKEPTKTQQQQNSSNNKKSNSAKSWISQQKRKKRGIMSVRRPVSVSRWSLLHSDFITCVHIYCFYQTLTHSITTPSLPKPPFEQQKLRSFSSMLCQDLTLWICLTPLSLTKPLLNCSSKAWMQIPVSCQPLVVHTLYSHLHQEHFASDLLIHCIRIANKWHHFPLTLFLENSALISRHCRAPWLTLLLDLSPLRFLSAATSAHRFFCESSRACRRSPGTCVSSTFPCSVHDL